jgi:AcrR family transcriptional regulator
LSARVGLNRRTVVEAAVEILEEGTAVDAVTLAAVAERLGVRTQSLYSHVDGLDGLRRELALHAIGALGRELSAAAMGRAGADAVEAIIRAYLGFAAAHPGLFGATLRAPGDDPDLAEAVATVTTPLNLVFRSYGLAPDALVHWYRLVWATVCGFAMLRREGLFTRPGHPDDTIRHMVRVFAGQLEHDAPARAAAAATAASKAAPKAAPRRRTRGL